VYFLPMMGSFLFALLVACAFAWGCHIGITRPGNLRPSLRASRVSVLRFQN
jgi:hypothetical protein